MSELIWTVELHSHTIYSGDCLLKPEDIPALCQRKGIDKLAVTDHNSVRAGLEMARTTPMLVIPGLEVMTTQGELLAWYVRAEVPSGLTPQETIVRLREQGAVIGVAHPFDRYRKGAWREEDLLAIVDDVDAIEVFNSRCIHDADNQKAHAFAQAHGKLMTCGSDAHTRYEYGRAVMQMPPFANNAKGFREALRHATRRERLSSPLVHFSSSYAKWLKRLTGYGARR
jgi:predicted metal-dependent phosphoesterase TrpH